MCETTLREVVSMPSVGYWEVDERSFEAFEVFMYGKNLD
jgi:hypothetical protein